MEKKKKQLYQAPELTVVAFQAERGYLVSNGILAIDPEYSAESTEYLESRDEIGSWGSGNGWF